MPRITLATFNVAPRHDLTRKYTGIGPVAVSRLRDYAALHGYGFIGAPNDPSAHPICWEKFDTILNALDRSEWCVWVDSDAMPVDLNRPLDTLLGNRDEVVSQCAVTYLRRLGWSDQKCMATMPFNSGVFAVKSIPTVRNLLTAARGRRPSGLNPNQPWNGVGDQEAIIDCLKDHPVSLFHEPLLQCHPGDMQNGAHFVHFYGNNADQLFDDTTAGLIIDDWHVAMAGRGDLPDNAPRYHWANIQNRQRKNATSRGGPARFLYQPGEIELG